MKVEPKQESELKREWPLLPDGIYPFTVLNSDEIASKSEKNKGKMMFAIKLNVHGPSGDFHIYDYHADWFSEWKLRHFADTTGQIKEYEAGNLDGKDGAFTARTGFVKIKTEAAGKWPAKNVVDDYVVKGEAKAAAPSEPPKEGDDVPF
jgi:hypothetical protein